MKPYIKNTFFLLLSLISLFAFTSCNSTGSMPTDTPIEAYYYTSSYLLNEDILEQYYVINNQADYDTLFEKLSSISFKGLDIHPEITENYFETKSLLMIPIIASSGSFTYEVTSIDSDTSSTKVSIKCNNKGTGTCDMATNIILVPIDYNYENIQVDIY